jgi:hypothetical protein
LKGETRRRKVVHSELIAELFPYQDSLPMKRFFVKKNRNKIRCNDFVVSGETLFFRGSHFFDLIENVYPVPYKKSKVSCSVSIAGNGSAI